METLRSGSTGDGVEALQKKLLGRGINPGPIDGVFGPKTQDSLKRFQEREGLDADGIAGSKTFTALGMMEAEEAHDLSDLAEEIEAMKDDDAGDAGGATSF
jgi:peptidoglycan hydrolase-like protein with peptidoglycan-binding domain